MLAGSGEYKDRIGFRQRDTEKRKRVKSLRGKRLGERDRKRETILVELKILLKNAEETFALKMAIHITTYEPLIPARSDLSKHKARSKP